MKSARIYSFLRLLFIPVNFFRVIGNTVVFRRLHNNSYLFILRIGLTRG